MKKIFLIPLLALMCSITAWADGTIAEMSVNGGTATPYTTFSALQAAINGLQNTDEALVTLKKTVELTADDAFTFHVPAGKNVTLNLNGYNLTQTIEATAPTCHYYYYGDEITPSSPRWPGYGAPGLQEVCDEPDANADIQENALIYNQGTLHIISEGSSIVQLINTGSAEVDKATTICNAGNLTIDGGIFVSTQAKIAGNNIKTPVIWNKTENDVTPVVNINGGTFLCDESRSDYNVGNLFPTIAGVCEMHIKGGIFSEDEMGADTKLNHPSTMAEINTKNADKANYTAILVPYTNANITGYNSATRTNVCPDPDGMKDATLYGTTDYKNKYRYAVKPVSMVIPENAGTDNLLFVSENTTITVPDGETLRVGEGGIVFGNSTTSKIIVEAGGALISDGDIVTSSSANLELTMDAVNDKYAQLMIKPNAIQDKHPDATVVLKSKAYKKDGAYTWQRFAVPTYLDGDQSLTRADMLYDNTTYPTALYRWNYTLSAENKWQVMLDDNEKFKPFDCYELTTNNTTKGGEYTFKCELVGNGDANLQLDNDRWSYFANSYTAPINIEEMLWELFTDATYKNNIAASVYVHNRADENWDLVSFADVLDGNATIENIDPMQAFVLWKIADIQDYTLHYKDVIYNPAMGIDSELHAPAPARRTQAGMDYQRASIVFSDENGKKDIVKLYEGSDFDNTLNNGFDVEKLMNEGQFSVYAVAEEGEMARLASDNIENATISMQTKGATTFTLSFENVKMEGYGVRDNLTNTTTEIKEGNTYHFSAPANAVVEGRFQVVAMPKITTAIENVENATATKGIYTLTGIYMGEDFNAVPAGIYIVNGKKMVK